MCKYLYERPGYYNAFIFKVQIGSSGNKREINWESPRKFQFLKFQITESSEFPVSSF